MSDTPSDARVPAGADAFITALIASLEPDPAVLGLVLAGSTAEPHRRDRWSDHDFLVITADGTPEGYRTDLSWLPDADDIGFSFRETAHGLKVLYRSGLILEFAIFDRAEFDTCALNHYAVAIDRGGIADAARRIRGRLTGPAQVDREAAFRNFLSLVYIGTGRARRGERLSANVLIRDYATAHLLRLAGDLLPERERTDLDLLDPWRRFEKAAPAFAAQVDTALSQPIERSGAALIEASVAFLSERWPECPTQDAALVLGLLARA